MQGFNAVVKPLGETRPAWKVLRVLANLLGLQGFEFESSQDVLDHMRGGQPGEATHVPAGKLSYATSAPIDLATGSWAHPAVASIYQLDGLVRLASSLQLTADARNAAILKGGQA